MQGRHRLRLELAAPHSDDALLKARLARQASHAASLSEDNVQRVLTALGVQPRWRRRLVERSERRELEEKLMLAEAKEDAEREVGLTQTRAPTPSLSRTPRCSADAER